MTPMKFASSQKRLSVSDLNGLIFELFSTRWLFSDNQGVVQEISLVTKKGIEAKSYEAVNFSIFV